MPVSHEDVRHVAALARLGLEPDRVSLLVAELNGILSHMDVLAAVDTSAIDLHAREDGQGMPLRSDDEAQVPLARGLETFAPSSRDGFFLVPRLATHEDELSDAGEDALAGPASTGNASRTGEPAPPTDRGA